jgi:hypothetical protein
MQAVKSFSHACKQQSLKARSLAHHKEQEIYNSQIVALARLSVLHASEVKKQPFPLIF